jgi:hypothetical protein
VLDGWEVVEVDDLVIVIVMPSGGGRLLAAYELSDLCCGLQRRWRYDEHGEGEVAATLADETLPSLEHRHEVTGAPDG